MSIQRLLPKKFYSWYSTENKSLYLLWRTHLPSHLLKGFSKCFSKKFMTNIIVLMWKQLTSVASEKIIKHASERTCSMYYTSSVLSMLVLRICSNYFFPAYTKKKREKKKKTINCLFIVQFCYWWQLTFKNWHWFICNYLSHFLFLTKVSHLSVRKICRVLNQVKC